MDAAANQIYVSRGVGRTNSHAGRTMGRPTTATRIFQCNGEDDHGPGFLIGPAPVPGGFVARAGTTFFCVSGSARVVWSRAVGEVPEDMPNFVLLHGAIIDLSNRRRGGCRLTVLDWASGHTTSGINLAETFSSGRMTIAGNRPLFLVSSKGGGILYAFDSLSAAVTEVGRVPPGRFTALAAGGADEDVLFGSYFEEPGLYRFRMATRHVDRIVDRPIRNTAVDEGAIICQTDESEDGRSDEELLVLDKTTARVLWSRPSAHHSIAASKSHVAAFVRTDQGRAVAFHDRGGRLLWQSPLAEHEKPRALDVCDDSVIARTWDGDRHLLTIHELGTGEARARLPLGEEPVTTESIDFDSHGLLVGVGHTIYRVH